MEGVFWLGNCIFMSDDSGFSLSLSPSHIYTFDSITSDHIDIITGGSSQLYRG